MSLLAPGNNNEAQGAAGISKRKPATTLTLNPDKTFKNKLLTNKYLQLLFLKNALNKISSANCEAIIQENWTLCDSKNECKSFINNNSLTCESKDCKAIIEENAELCESSHCKIILKDKFTHCDDNDPRCKALTELDSQFCQQDKDCRSLLEGNMTNCQTPICKAVIQDNFSLCH